MLIPMTNRAMDAGLNSMESEPALDLVRIRKILFVVTAFFCIAIPGLASLKGAAILLTWIYTVLTGEVRTRSIIWFLSCVLNIACFSVVALQHGVSADAMLNHMTRFLLFFFVLGIGASVARGGSLDRKTTDGLILGISLFAAALKIVILFLIDRGTLTLNAAMARLGFETVTSEIGFGLQRLQFPSDVAVIFLIAAYYGGRRKIVDLLFLIAISLDVFLSFSRYFFAAFAACLLIRFIRVRRADAVSGFALVIIAVVLATFSDTLATRFLSQSTEQSDTVRSEQMGRLSEVIAEHPLFGTGIGSSINSYVRSDTVPYSYEVQWYAMAMQLGSIGLCWFSLNLLAPLALCLEASRGRFVFIPVLILWIAGGFTNPLIVSLGSAFGLSILVLVLVTDQATYASTSP